MAYKRFEADDRVIVSLAELLKYRLDPVKYKKGFCNTDITSDHGTSRVYSTVFFRLMELMIMDVIAGDIVYFDRKIKSRFYVDYKDAPQAMINGKGITDQMRIPLIDFRATRYRVPIIAFDPGYKNSTPCEVFIPTYLYSMLIESVNAGKKYTKGTKDFWHNKKK